MLYLKQSKLPTRGEVRSILLGCLVTVALMACIYWLAFYSGITRASAMQIMSGQADIRQGLERIERHQTVTAAIASQEAEKAVGHYRRLRELADTIPVNPFQKGGR